MPEAKPDAALEGPGDASISPGHRRGAEKKNRRGAHIWAEPASGPPCAGVCGQACTLSLDGSGNPGTASAEDPRCVFCSADRFQQLARQQNGGMVTFYLSRLKPLHQKEALRTIEVHGGSAMRLSYVTRLKRRMQRRDPTRPKRKPRGSYGARRPAAASRQTPWGVDLPQCQNEEDEKKTKHEDLAVSTNMAASSSAKRTMKASKEKDQGVKQASQLHEDGRAQEPEASEESAACPKEIEKSL